MYRAVARWVGVTLIGVVLVVGSFVEGNFGLTEWRTGQSISTWGIPHPWPGPVYTDEIPGTKIINMPLDTAFMWLVVFVIVLLMREHLTFGPLEGTAPAGPEAWAVSRRFKKLKHSPAGSAFPKRHPKYRPQLGSV